MAKVAKCPSNEVHSLESLAVIEIPGLAMSGRTLQVSADGSSAFQTISDAIASAQFGDTVRILRGRYEEQLALKNGVFLIGDGSENTLVEWKSAMTVVKAIGVKIGGLINLTVRHSGNRFRETTPDENTVLQTGAAILISDSNILVVAASVMGAETGIHVCGLSRPIIARCLLEKNMSGIECYGQSHCTLRFNTLRKNEFCGAVVSEDAEAVIESNCFESNCHDAIVVEGKARAQLSNNICTQNLGNAISYCGDCEVEGIVEENIFDSNNGNGLYCGGNARLSVNKNVSRKNKRHGIECVGPVRLRLSSNECAQNGYAGLACCISTGGHGGHVTLESNILRSNLRGGAWIMPGVQTVPHSDEGLRSSNQFFDNLEGDILRDEARMLCRPLST